MTSISGPLAAPCTHVAALQRVFGERHRMNRSLVDRGRAAFGQPWEYDLDRTLQLLFGDASSMEAAAKGYTAFAMDSMRRQQTFETAREYPNKTYAEAASEVYFNDDYMRREYLPGLLLSHFLWPHHYRQLQFFDNAFAAPMSVAGVTDFCEIGVGTGLYSRRLLEALPAAIGHGYDISPTSCDFAAAHIAATGAAGRYTMHKQDVVEQPVQPVARLVCVEVLEHLEQPLEFLHTLRRALAPGGKAFITAAVNAANADHIYLYRHAQEVEAHLEAAGFRLEQAMAAAAYAPPAPGVPVPLAAAFVVT